MCVFISSLKHLFLQISKKKTGKFMAWLEAINSLSRACPVDSLLGLLLEARGGQNGRMDAALTKRVTSSLLKRIVPQSQSSMLQRLPPNPPEVVTAALFSRIQYHKSPNPWRCTEPCRHQERGMSAPLERSPQAPSNLGHWVKLY